MWAFMLAMRMWNQVHKHRPLGFYGFQTPTAARAVQVGDEPPGFGCRCGAESVAQADGTRASRRTRARIGIRRVAPPTARSGIHAVRRPSSPPKVLGGVACVLFTNGARHARHRVRRIDGVFDSPSREHRAPLTCRDTRRTPSTFSMCSTSLAPARSSSSGGERPYGPPDPRRPDGPTGVPLGDKLGDKHRVVAFAIGGGTIASATSQASRVAWHVPRGGGHDLWLTPTMSAPPARIGEIIVDGRGTVRALANGAPTVAYPLVVANITGNPGCRFRSPRPRTDAARRPLPWTLRRRGHPLPAGRPAGAGRPWAGRAAVAVIRTSAAEAAGLRRRDHADRGADTHDRSSVLPAGLWTRQRC